MILNQHEPFTDFSTEETSEAYKNGLELEGVFLGIGYPLIIGGECIPTEKKTISYNPAKKSEVMGIFSEATIYD